jgi:hypothetical protein
MEFQQLSLTRIDLGELIDRLSILNLHEIHGETCSFELSGEINSKYLQLNECMQSLTNEDRVLVTALAIALAHTNLAIWTYKDVMKKDGNSFYDGLVLSHQVNGVRNQLKNKINFLFSKDVQNLKSNVGTDNLKGWDLTILSIADEEILSSKKGISEHPHLLSDLLNNITIIQIKEIKLGRLDAELRHSLIDQIIAAKHILDRSPVELASSCVAYAIYLAILNQKVWLLKDEMTSLDGESYNLALSMAQDFNSAKNYLINHLDLFVNQPRRPEKKVFFSPSTIDRLSELLGRISCRITQTHSGMSRLSVEEFRRVFNIAEADLSGSEFSSFSASRLHYRVLDDNETERTYLESFMKVDKSEFLISSAKSQPIWDKGWKENLNDLVLSNNLSALNPRFLGTTKIHRFGSGFIEPESRHFEYDVIDLYRSILFRKYFSDCRTIIEIGAGSCQHIPALASLFPDKELVVCDWSPVTVEISTHLRSRFGFNVKGFVFDIFNPSTMCSFNGPVGVLTVGALEKVGDGFLPFLKFLLQLRPVSVLNIEVLVELYSSNTIHDYSACRYDNHRHSLKGFVPGLIKLRDEGALSIFEIARVTFGSQYHDGYSRVAWGIKA